MGIQYTGIQFNNLYYIDLEELSILSNYPNGNNFSWNDGGLKNYLDLYIGVEFNKFIFSWHFTNVLAEDYLINSNQAIQNFYMQYFVEKCRFDN